jgi:hypothetical protein
MPKHIYPILWLISALFRGWLPRGFPERAICPQLRDPTTQIALTGVNAILLTKDLPVPDVV